MGARYAAEVKQVLNQQGAERTVFINLLVVCGKIIHTSGLRCQKC